jgi:hypothetical protein
LTVDIEPARLARSLESRLIQRVTPMILRAVDQVHSRAAGTA